MAAQIFGRPRVNIALENGDSHKISGELKPRFSEYHCGNSVHMPEVDGLFRLIRLELEIRKFSSTTYRFLSQISNLIKQEDVISIEKLCSKCRSSLDIDTQGGLTEFISYKPDEISKSIMPFILLNIEKGQTTVPVRYVACVHSKQYVLTYVIIFCLFTRKM